MILPLLALLPLSAFANPLPGANDRLLQFSSDAISAGASLSSLVSGGVKTNTRWSFSDCGEPDDAIIIEELTVNPDPPQAGKTLTIDATGLVQTEIKEGSYANVLVKLGLIKILNKTFDICEELENANSTLRCPIQPGRYTIQQSVELPKEIPKAKFLVSARAFTQDDEPMACADIMIDFMIGHN
ncbi:hypothetical protein BT69DRAFT_1354363 [Atractiella rhizophila]|nr:hypothetical protein BT69DRAFT_1354363 [Atractiella rhizophila]